MDYYHIADKESRKWSQYEPVKVGDTLITGTVNPYFNYYLFPDYPKDWLETSNGLVEVSRLYVLQEIKEGRAFNSDSKYVARLGFETAKFFSNYTRELIWENIRKEEFSELPSRQKCIWLAEGEDNLNYWLRRIGKDSKEYNIFRVVPNGKLHTASDEHLLSDVEPYETTLNKARQYWHGVVKNPLAREILFEGILEVREQVN
ncbi:DUF2441 domain-containing protein [Cronobacter sakazakii]|uniref:DUF2441 domain-containing protein n=2 Tax=root TaxID=1 RepID=UPI00025F67CD|nr:MULTISPECIES: DUF2441 domain-containing protein [Cronobacter]YP_006590032.1 DUF2441 domain-containing protein [Cronobacter phage phiES15]AFH14949.1 hypothetical protein phiES15_027 [Cronobacter phage phiES15]AFJ98457.1 hypothetical protein ES15_0884 [Cronobacter sakazakii ES15]EJT7705353.1 DUF2441 domain-containing protein [Cronobacter sakazakii]ELY2518346.1 DUF2441 domain-containing protein [Cronobacter sakazakii]ELY3704869.1 DUF2441 domain-containing protein [Cronobacter sakazakii]